MVHGIGFSDRSDRSCWGRIPYSLREKGAEVYFGCQDAYGSIQENAAALYDTVSFLHRYEGIEKVNIIAHSKGGLDARYMISNFDLGRYVASLTTLCTPHHGIMAADYLERNSQRRLDNLIRSLITLIELNGGESTDDLTEFKRMSVDFMDVFNYLVPDIPGVYYASYACDMMHKSTDPAMAYYYSLIYKLEGPNDGLVSTGSAKWGDFKGIYKGEAGEGISHHLVTGGHRLGLFLPAAKDLDLFYERLVGDLISMGF